MSILPVVNDSNFESEVMKSTAPVLVEFGATWCQPCKVLEPLLGQLLAGEWGNKVRIVKVDVEDSPEVTTRLGVMNLPTLILIKGGKDVERVSGMQSRDKLVDRFGKHF